MPTFSLNISCTIIQVQGDINLTDRSQTTTNMDSFNAITTTLTNQSSAPESPLETTPSSDVPLDEVFATSNTMSYQQSDGILRTGSEARSTLTSSSMSVDSELEDIYPSPSSRVFAQDERAAEHHNSNCSTDSLNAPDSESLNSPPLKKNFCQHVMNKLKRWFH